MNGPDRLPARAILFAELLALPAVGAAECDPNRPLLAALVAGYFGEGAAITLLPPPRVKTAAKIKEAVRRHPAVNLLEKEMGARLIDYGHQG